MTVATLLHYYMHAYTVCNIIYSYSYLLFLFLRNLRKHILLRNLRKHLHLCNLCEHFPIFEQHATNNNSENITPAFSHPFVPVYAICIYYAIHGYILYIYVATYMHRYNAYNILIASLPCLAKLLHVSW